MNQYQKIAKKYQNAVEEEIIGNYSVEPTLKLLLKSITNKSVLDIGCGEGRRTRLIKKQGASEVFGVDASRAMIKLAKQTEEKSPLGIKYACYEADKLPTVGSYDIATAFFVIHYAKNKVELAEMAKNIFKNLKSGGVLFCFNNNPDNPVFNDDKYGITIGPKNVREGDQIDVTFYKGKAVTVKFKCYYWKRETYTKALQDAGFSEIEWKKPFVSKEGLEKFGKSFWEDFFKKPTYIIITAKKPSVFN